ncbi:unnamed protein product [Chrysoparadoxa australica]
MSSCRLCARIKAMKAEGGNYRFRSRGFFEDGYDQTSSLSSPGAEMRRYVQIVLALSCFSRGTTLMMDVVAFNPNAPYRTVPDVLFLTTYSILALFWAQLCLAAEGTRFRWLQPLFVGGWSLLVLVFLVLCGLEATTDSNAMRYHYKVALFFLTGVGYFLVCIAIAYFGARVSMAARRQKAVYCRILLLCICCSIVLLTRSIFYMAYGRGYRCLLYTLLLRLLLMMML